jgi:type II secretory pathway component PulF
MNAIRTHFYEIWATDSGKFLIVGSAIASFLLSFLIVRFLNYFDKLNGWQNKDTESMYYMWFSTGPIGTIVLLMYVVLYILFLFVRKKCKIRRYSRQRMQERVVEVEFWFVVVAVCIAYLLT